MKHENSMVALYDTHKEAEQAVKKIAKKWLRYKATFNCWKGLSQG